MNPNTRYIAALQLLLMSPAALFMTAIVVRDLKPRQWQASRAAQQIVSWYAARPHVGLWVLLMALPLAALAIGCVTLSRAWQGAAVERSAGERFAAMRADSATLIVGATTALSAVVLAIVAVHALMN